MVNKSSLWFNTSIYLSPLNKTTSQTIAFQHPLVSSNSHRNTVFSVLDKTKDDAHTTASSCVYPTKGMSTIPVAPPLLVTKKNNDVNTQHINFSTRNKHLNQTVNKDSNSKVNGKVYKYDDTKGDLELQKKSFSLFLHSCGGVNFIPDKHFNAATWDDIDVDIENGEVMTMFGFDIQGMKVQRLKKLMGILKIKGRKKFQNSRTEMLSCLLHHWKQQNQNRPKKTTTADGKVRRVYVESVLEVETETDAKHVAQKDIHGAERYDCKVNCINAPTKGDNGDIPIPTVATSITCGDTGNGSLIQKSSDNATVTSQMPKLELFYSNIGETNRDFSSYMHEDLPHDSILLSSSNEIPVTMNEQQQEQDEYNKDPTPSSTIQFNASVINALNLAMLSSSNVSRPERKKLIRKAEERLEAESKREEKRLKLEETKLRIESLKEMREEEEYRNKMLEVYTSKVRQLREQAAIKSFNNDANKQETLDMLEYYLNARKRLIGSHLG